MKTYEIKDFLEVKSAGGASLSPDGSKLSFLSNNTGTYQVYLVGSQGGEPEQITAYDDSIDFAVFSPTKDEILFGKSEKGNEQTQFYLYSLETKNIKALTDNSKIKHNFGRFSQDGTYIAYSNNERNGKDFDVYIRNLETGNVECVYNEGGLNNAVGFSPKNTYLIIKKIHGNFNVDFYLLNLKDKKLELITEHEGDVYFSGTSWMPDESGFYTITNKERDFIGLSKFDVATKQFEYMLTPEWDVEGISISMDGQYLNVMVNEDGYSKLTMYKTDTFAKVPLESLPETGMIYSALFSKDSKYLALSVGDSRHTTDIWIYSIEEQRCWQVTFSSQGVPAEELIDPELFRYTSFDGLEIPAFLYKPKHIQESQKIPVIINIHGGPESQFQPSFALLIQYFVYHGYAVIGPNVRGSAGYGKKYLALDDVEKRLDSVHDLAWLHSHIKTIPYLDEDKVVLMGGSYGGYMTLAGLAFHPELWIGGVDIVGIVNFVTFLENTAPYRRAMREVEYGSLEKNRELLESISPINHIENIKAPLFVIHGSNDPRVPLNEAEQIVEKLNALGRKAELLVYEDEGHGLSKLKNRLDAYPKVLQFLENIFASQKNK